MASWSSIARASSALSIAGAILLVYGCRQKQPLPVYGAVPEFTLMGQDGRPFDSHALDDKVWVADFFFTSCTGPCPRMSSMMRRIQNDFKGERGLNFVSFTVDPARDHPAALAAYAKRFQADPDRWHFLTGRVDELNRLSLKVFKLGAVTGNSLDHSTRFVLVDRRRRIRGFYLTAEPDALKHLTSDIRSLLDEGAG
ncbi:MAG TPA: SCO family protein [Bryobacteraceae bacterium]|nr:SCO family protein [Bryobacteraceae bacterium]